MKKIEAPTLQEAYTKAAQELECSITELDFEIIQNPAGGLFGLFKKNAIIIAKCKALKQTVKKPKQEQKHLKEKREKRTPKKYNQTPPQQKQPTQPQEPKEEIKRVKRNSFVDDMINDFHSETLSKEEIIQEIEKDVKELFRTVAIT